MLDGMTDDELLRLYASSNNRDALGILFRRHVDSAYATAMRVCRNPADADDAVQAAFVKVMQTAGNFRAGLQNWSIAAFEVSADGRRGLSTGLRASED